MITFLRSLPKVRLADANSTLAAATIGHFQVKWLLWALTGLAALVEGAQVATGPLGLWLFEPLIDGAGASRVLVGGTFFLLSIFLGCTLWLACKVSENRTERHVHGRHAKTRTLFLWALVFGSLGLALAGTTAENATVLDWLGALVGTLLFYAFNAWRVQELALHIHDGIATRLPMATTATARSLRYVRRYTRRSRIHALRGARIIRAYARAVFDD